ncbi:MAG: HD domain-containing protein [Candidatus Woesearchaeota archaeon]
MIDFDYIRKQVKEELVDEPSGHNYAHVMRVFKNVVLIGQTEDVDMDVVKAAALLHDIAYAKKFFKGEYAKTSHDIARDMLKEKYFTTDQIDAILEAIRQHDVWANYKEDVPVEVKVLRDADRLDYLGYTGIVKAVSYAAHANKNIIKLLERIIELENEFETKKGKELSKPRLKITKEFLDGLREEY